MGPQVKLRPLTPLFHVILVPPLDWTSINSNAIFIENLAVIFLLWNRGLHEVRLIHKVF